MSAAVQAGGRPARPWCAVSDRLRIGVNLVAFQTGWWAILLSVRAGHSSLIPGVLAILLVLHLATAPRRRVESAIVGSAAALGYAVDTLATLAGALRFAEPGPAGLPTPLWIAALWVAFATSLTTTFRGLRGRPVAAAVLGALSGPAAYGAGSALGVVELPVVLWSVAALGLLWGGLLPLLVSMAQAIESWFNQPRDSGPEIA